MPSQFIGIFDGDTLNYSEGCDVISISERKIGIDGNPTICKFSFLIEHPDLFYSIKIDKGSLIIPSGGDLSPTEFTSFFPIGEFNYDSTLLNGVSVRIIDNFGKKWSTKSGTGDQTGSTFKIVNRMEYLFYGDYKVKVKISLSCKLYDDLGNVKSLTDAIVIGPFSELD